ncbi:hypothetical protein K523DRAFT_370760 [Schizophyllum commune Tattone D]|nr:hypothetical protein K523DRAFT_370760 [Schizophyllum commune Tattone D]
MSFFGLVSATEAVLSPVADVSLDTLATFDDQPSVLFSPHPQLGSLMDLGQLVGYRVPRHCEQVSGDRHRAIVPHHPLPIFGAPAIVDVAARLEPYRGVADASPHCGAGAVEQFDHPFASHSIAFFTHFAYRAYRHAPCPCAYPGEAQVRAPSASLPGFYPVAHVAGARHSTGFEPWSIDSAPVSIACLAEFEVELETDAKRGTARVGETETATVERSEVRDFSLAVISILPAFIGASISSATWKIQRGWHLTGPQGSRIQEKRGRNEVRNMSSLALLMAGMAGAMPVAHAANIGRQLTTTTGTTTTSAGSSTATLSPTFIFSSVDEMSTCEGADIKWVYAGPDAQVRLEISSIDVIQSAAPSSTTSQTVSRSLHLTMSDGTLTPARREATGIITSEAASPSSGGITSLISTDIRASARTFTWSSVEVPQGWYHLNASIPSRNYVANLSPSFYVRNGADTSCLLGASTTTTSGSQGAETSSSATGSSATAVAVGASSSNPVDAGTIAGAVIGSIAGVTLLAGAFLWFLCRRRRQHKRTPSGVETASMRQTKPSKQPKPYATNGPFGLQHHHRSSDGSQGHILSHASHGSASESTVGACTSPTSESEEKLESAVPTRANSHEQRRSAEAPRRASTEHRRTPSYPPQAPTPEVTPPAAAVTRAPTTRKTPRKPVPSYIAAEETGSAPASPTTPAAAASASSAPALVHRSSDNSVKGSVNTVDTPTGGKTSRRRSLQAKGEADRGRVGHYAVGSARSATLDPTRPDLKNKNSWDERPMHFLIPDMPPPPPQ